VLDFSLPEGMPLAGFQKHPVTVLIRDSAYHGRRAVPSTPELDALDLPPDARRRVKQACEEAAATHDTGHHADAWAQGDRAAAGVIADLDPEQRDPAYRDQPEDLTGLNPTDLAARVPRM
jgi:hypothetical protein